MARLYGKLTASSEVPLDLEDLIAGMAQADSGDDGWQEAIMRYLSGGEGWRDAFAQLDGTFASGAGSQTREGSGEQGVNQQVSEYLQRAPLKSKRIGND